MGIFQDNMEVFNRTPWNLTIRFDGQEMTLLPGVNHIPKSVLFYALNQNPMAGTQDPDNPHASGATYLIGIPEKKNKYPCTPLTADEIKAQKDNPSRYDYVQMMQDRMGPKDTIEVRGRKLPSAMAVKETIATEFGAND